MNNDISEDNDSDKNISKLIIDSKPYFFKLSENQSFDYLSKLSKLVEAKIFTNKEKFHLKDYEKLLILTSLNLAEDVVKLKKQIENLSQGDDPSGEKNLPSTLQIIERLEHLRDTLETAEPIPKENQNSKEGESSSQ